MRNRDSTSWHRRSHGAPRQTRSPGRAALTPLRSIWLRRHWDGVLFAAACTLLVYLGGMATTHYNLLPYTTIRDSVRAAREWHANWRSYLGIAPTKFLVPAEGEEKGVVVHVPGAPQPGLSLISGISEDGLVGLQLIDLEGRVRHRWPASFSRIWPDPEHVDAR